jgi:hypothetical protein
MSETEGWKKEDKQKLRAIEQGVRDEVDGLEEYPVDLDSGEDLADTRDYVDVIYKDHIPGVGVQNKKVRGARCQENVVPKIGDGVACIVFDYKTKKTQGKRDPLAGNHLLHLSTPKGPIQIPLHLARKFFLNGLRLMDGIEDGLAVQNLSMTPGQEEED